MGTLKNNNSFLYPQGFHIGHLYCIVKKIGDEDFSFPLNPETYSPADYDKTVSKIGRQTRYKIWALMEACILEDHRKTGDHLSYQKLTETGKEIYENLREMEDADIIPPHFFERKANDSWRMKLSPREHINFTLTTKVNKPKSFDLLREIFLNLTASKDLIRYLIEAGGEINKDELYRNYFRNPYVRISFTKRGLKPHSISSIDTARRRISVIVGLLESVGVVSGFGKPMELIKLLEIQNEIYIEELDKLESAVEEEVKELSSEEVIDKIREFEARPPRRKLYKTVTEVCASDEELKSYMKKLAGYKCQYCGAEAFKTITGRYFIHAHHIIPLEEEKYPNPDVPSNILVLCSWCHDKMHHAEKEQKKKMYNEFFKKGIITNEKVNELEHFNII